MLINKLINNKEKLSSGNISEIVSLDELFNCKNNSFVKEALKHYYAQGYDMEVRIFIEDKIKLFANEKKRQLSSTNENQRLTFKVNSDFLLKDTVRFMKLAERENIDMLPATTNLVTILDDLYIEYCAHQKVDAKEILSNDLHNQILEMCRKTNASIVIYLYPFFEDRACIDSYLNVVEYNFSMITSPEFPLMILRKARYAIKNKTNMLDHENSLSGNDLHYLYTKLKDMIFEKSDNYDLLRMYQHKETDFVITERNTTDLFLSLMERNNFELISAILDKHDNAFADYKKILNQLNPNLLNNLMQTSIEKQDADIATLLYTSKKSTHNNEKPFFFMIKQTNSFRNIFTILEYLISEYRTTNDKQKCAIKMRSFAYHLLLNIEDLKYEMFESCNKYFEHEFVDKIDFICHIYPQDLGYDYITELREKIHLDFKPMPELDKKDD